MNDSYFHLPNGNYSEHTIDTTDMLMIQAYMDALKTGESIDNKRVIGIELRAVFGLGTVAKIRYVVKHP